MSKSPSNGRGGEEEIDGYYTHYEWGDDENLSDQLISLVESISEEDGRALSPLHETVDVDALDALFEPTGREAHRGPGSVTFPYAGYQVTVYSSGTIVISSSDGQSTPPAVA